MLQMTKRSRSLCASLAYSASTPAARLLELVYKAYESESSRVVFQDIQIIGDSVFSNRVRDGIRKLEFGDRHGYQLVRRYLNSVVATEKEIGLGYLIGVRFEPVTTAGYIDADTARFAACLVRYAIYRRLLQGYHICVWRDRDAQTIALKRELHCMRLLNCTQIDLQCQIDFIRRKQSRRQLRVVLPM